MNSFSHFISEKFLDSSDVEKVKERLRMSLIAEMFRKEAADEKLIEVSKNLIVQGVEFEVIAKATGLDTEKLEELKSEIEE